MDEPANMPPLVTCVIYGSEPGSAAPISKECASADISFTKFLNSNLNYI